MAHDGIFMSYIYIYIYIYIYMYVCVCVCEHIQQALSSVVKLRRTW